MGKLVVTEDVSLDELKAADALVLGRRTYQALARAWPRMTGLAERMDSMPKYVVSTTLAAAAWNNTTVLSSVADVAAVRELHAGTILVPGSATLVAALRAEGLID